MIRHVYYDAVDTPIERCGDLLLTTDKALQARAGGDLVLRTDRAFQAQAGTTMNAAAVKTLAFTAASTMLNSSGNMTLNSSGNVILKAPDIQADASREIGIRSSGPLRLKGSPISQN